MAESMKRGQVRWVVFNYPDKRRPAVVLTRTPAIGYLTTVTVAEITTTVRGSPSQVLLGPEDGLPTNCSVNLYNVQTVTKGKVGPIIALLSESKLLAVEEALLFALGMERYEHR